MYYQKVKVGNEVFISMTQAGRAHGIERTTVKNRCESNTFPDWSFVKEEVPIKNTHPPEIRKLLSESSKRKKVYIPTKEELRQRSKDRLLKCRKHPVTILGKKYFSALDAAKELNMNVESILLRCKNKHYPDWIFTGENPFKFRRPVSVNGVEYPSIALAARTLKINASTIVRRCDMTEYQDWFFV